MDLPLIDDFETFNEINISSIDWTDASGLVDLQNESCQAVAQVRPDANISSSGLSAGDAFPTGIPAGTFRRLGRNLFYSQ